MLLIKTDVRMKTLNCYNKDDTLFLIYEIVIDNA